ncbi:hypothetical protein Tco_0008560 [Tanacetum coccineum]
MSSAEAEYVAAAGCCAQVLWIKSQLADYDVLYDKVPIFCDNTSAIAISNNPVLHFRTKHIDIRYHFSRDHILKGDIKLHFIPTDLQLADIFTKPLVEPSFTRLVAELGMLNIEKQLNFEPEESLILSSEEVNAEESADKSQSRTNMQPLSQPKAPTAKEPRKKKIPSSTQLKQTEEFVVTADATKSLDASELAEVQGIQPHTADAEKVLDQIVEEEEVAKEHPLVIPTDEADPAVATNISFMGSGPIDMTLDNVVSSSELSSMPDDDLHYVSAFDNVKSGDDEDDDMADSKHIVKKGTSNTFLNTSTEYHNLSGHLDHVCEEVSNLHSKIVDMESLILQLVSDQIKDHVPTLISNALQAQLHSLLTNALKESESDHFITLQKALTSVLQSEMGQSVTFKVRSGMQEVRDDLNSQRKSLGKFCLEGETAKTIPSSEPNVKSQEEQPADLKVANKESTPLVSYDMTNGGKELVVYKAEEKKLEKTISMEDDSDEDDLDKQPLSKGFKIEPPIPMNSFVPKHLLKPKEQQKSIQEFTDQLFETTSSKYSPRELTPPKDSSKGKEVAIIEQVNKLVLFQEEGGSNPKLELKRLVDMKAEKDKSEQELRKMFNPTTLKAQAQKWTEHEAKKAKMIEEYNHQITFRADPLPITKISYVVNLNKELGLPPPPELVTFGMIVEDKKRKRTELLKEDFTTKDIRVDGMDRNLIPLPGFVSIQGLVINKPELRIFIMNGNTGLAFQRESEFHLTPTV